MTDGLGLEFWERRDVRCARDTKARVYPGLLLGIFGVWIGLEAEVAKDHSIHRYYTSKYSQDMKLSAHTS